MFRAVQLYTFLEYCESSSLEKEVLDCGAGVGYFHEPPLMRFFEFDYKTYGIDISSERVEIARKFCEEHQIDLNIRQGDMRELPLEDESMSFVFSYNTIYQKSSQA
jgi:ubiquinone/menaquinone biosynthesis C-methylase UbiE